jgi:hypothetical protein
MKAHFEPPMRPVFLLVPCFLLVPGFVGFACSSSSSPAGTKDAGVEATADVTDDACFPFCGSSGGGSGSSGGGDDGGDASCAELKAQIETLQAPAQACNPTEVNQCNGATQGICCAITVTAGNDPAANAFEQAVTAYKSMCDAGCMTPVCPTVPSNDCHATQGTQGVCQ